MRAEAVLQIDGRILVRLIQVAFALVEGESRRVGGNNMQASRGFIERDMGATE